MKQCGELDCSWQLRISRPPGRERIETYALFDKSHELASISRPPGRERIETYSTRIDCSDPRGISRPPGRERIETQRSRGFPCTQFRVSPGPRAGSGLKPTDVPSLSHSSLVSPGPRAGSGLKPDDVFGYQERYAVSPGPRAGSGLKLFLTGPTVVKPLYLPAPGPGAD